MKKSDGGIKTAVTSAGNRQGVSTNHFSMDKEKAAEPAKIGPAINKWRGGEARERANGILTGFENWEYGENQRINGWMDKYGRKIGKGKYTKYI